MRTEKLNTKYAPAETVPDSEIKRKAFNFSNNPMLKELLDAVPDTLMVLNEQRQLVFANKAMNDFIQFEDIEAIHGKRPGEIIHCMYAEKEPGGCGTSEFCRKCGALKAILTSLKGDEDVQECRILQKSGDALDLRVWTKPLSLNGEKFTVFTIKDIEDEKRRRVLERIFFHDIINTAGSLKGMVDILKSSPEETEELSGLIYNISEKLIDEIMAQKQLSAAESNDLIVSMDDVNSMFFVRNIVETYRKHYVAEGMNIEVAQDAVDFNFSSDVTLLSRVIGNMLKNALEASDEGDTVTINCMPHDGHAQFSVHNPAYMPRDIQLQIFQRSFSTKGTDRGLGTYSIKLLSERYLKGDVSFKSSEEEGTTFFGLYPLKR